MLDDAYVPVYSLDNVIFQCGRLARHKHQRHRPKGQPRMPALGGRQKYDVTLRDVTGEATTHTVFFDEITAISLPGLLTLFGNYNTALIGITNGVLAKDRWGEETIVSNATPSDNSAQRESKLLVQYRGATTEKPYTLTIGTIDFDKLVFLPGAGDAVAFEAANGASAEIQAWVTAFEALASAPDDEAENVVVTGMRYVGRNT